MFNNIRTVVINFQTPDLLKTAVETYRRFYPECLLTIVDNGSKDASKKIIEELRLASPKYTTTIYLDSNIYHGPAMDMAMKKINEEYVFFLDSDTETKKGGFLESMQSGLESDERAYGIGFTYTVNKRGFPSPSGILVLAPAFMMLRRLWYKKFPPFEHHGQPILKNFKAAQEQGYTLTPYPIDTFIDHRWRGTAERFGYGLGWKGKMDFLLNKIGM